MIDEPDSFIWKSTPFPRTGILGSMSILKPNSFSSSETVEPLFPMIFGIISFPTFILTLLSDIISISALGSNLFTTSFILDSASLVILLPVFVLFFSTNSFTGTTIFFHHKYIFHILILYFQNQKFQLMV